MLIYLCDLSHTTQGYNSELVPYAVAGIGEYLKRWSGIPVEVCLFKDPKALDAGFNQGNPDIVAFSNYMWNSRLSIRYARAIKAAYPQVLTVFGGPHFSLNAGHQEAWMKSHPEIDIYLLGEGEAPFCQTIVNYEAFSRSISQVKANPINGQCSWHEETFSKHCDMLSDGTDNTPRLTDLEAIPSPYLSGALDRMLADPQLVPLIETTRGCPFTCTFCVDGIAARSAIRRYSLERLAAELRYIAARTTTKTLFIADTNFGMYRQDVAYSEVIRQVQEETGYPEYINASTGKNHKERVIQVARNTGGALRVAASVQSLDPEVLGKIRRDNISPEGLAQVAQELRNDDNLTYSEMILGLPGDTREKHVEGVIVLAEMGFDQLRMHQLTLLPGSEMDLPVQRQEHEFQTSYRVLQRSFGCYPFQGKMLKAAEIEEVVIGHRSFTAEDYFYCRNFALTIALVHNERGFYELAQFLRALGLSYGMFLRFLHESAQNDPGSLPQVLQSVYRQYALGARSELYKVFSSLLYFLDPGELMDALLQGLRGNNLLFNAQGRVFYSHYQDLAAWVFVQAKVFAEKQERGLTPGEEVYVDELYTYCLARKGHLSELEAVEEVVLHYDIEAQEKDFWAKIPPRGDGRLYRFTFTPEQQDFWRLQRGMFGDTNHGLGKMIARAPMKYSYREVSLCGLI